MTRDETEVQSRTIRYLEGICGEGHVHDKVHLRSGWGVKGNLDVVGVCSNGSAYVCECEDAMLRAAAKGLGQLLMYRVFVEQNFPPLQDTLSSRGEERGRLEKMRTAAVRYLLALPQARRTLASEEILRKAISYVTVADTEARVDLLYV